MPPSLRQVGSKVVAQPNAVDRVLNQKSECVDLNPVSHLAGYETQASYIISLETFFFIAEKKYYPNYLTR